MESDALKIEFEYPGDMRLAMVACLLAGCGHGNPSADVVVDAGADAGADAPVDVDPASLVTIHVYTAAGVDDTTAIAMFADDTGAYVATTVVDSHGDATASLPHGGTVTALQIVTDDTLHEFDTFTSFHGVKPGDHLVAGRPLSNDQPSGATDTMAASYTSHSNNTPGGVMSCGSVDFGLNTPAATLTFYASCEAATFDLLAIQDVGTQRMFLWQPGLAHTAGGTVALPDAWQSVGTLALEVDNAPGNRAHTGAEYEALVDGIPMELDFQSIQLAPAGTNLFTLHPAVGAGTKTRITVGANDDGGYLAESLTAIVEPDTTALTLDMAAHPLPLPGTFGKTSPTDITWTETASGTGDLRVVWCAMDRAWQQHPAPSCVDVHRGSARRLHVDDDPAVARCLREAGRDSRRSETGHDVAVRGRHRLFRLRHGRRLRRRASDRPAAAISITRISDDEPHLARDHDSRDLHPRDVKIEGHRSSGSVVEPAIRTTCRDVGCNRSRTPRPRWTRRRSIARASRPTTDELEWLTLLGDGTRTVHTSKFENRRDVEYRRARRR
jgi:hypothetical protein